MLACGFLQSVLVFRTSSSLLVTRKTLDYDQHLVDLLSIEFLGHNQFSIMAKIKKSIISSGEPWLADRIRTVSTIAAPANIASSERDDVVLGNGNFNLGCVFGSHKLEPTFLNFRFNNILWF